MNLQLLSPLRWVRVLLSVTIVACVSLICYDAFGVNATTAGFAYLLSVLGIAANWGLLEALVASAAAAGCYSFFFLPPIGRLVISDPQNWLAMVTFVVTALVASHLSDRAKKEAKDARERERESRLLYSFSRATLLSDTRSSVGFETASNLASIFDLSAVYLYNADAGEIFRAGPEALTGIDTQLLEAGRGGFIPPRDDSEVLIAAIRNGDRCIGSLAAKKLLLSPEALDALLNLVAIAFEHVRTQQAANRAEAARQSEEFKSTLLDAVTHEFKTPLTSIKAASSSILTDVAEAAPHVRELATIINDGADRLNLLVTDAVRMAQMDASHVQLERKAIPAGEFVRRVLDVFEGRWEDRQIHFDIPENLPLIAADPDLASMAFRQVIDNALKYSSPGTPLRIAAEANGFAVKIHVRDYGPGIAEPEQKRIFERFYRQPGIKEQVPGSGLGLYVAREIIRAHGGDLWAESAPGSGADFCMMLPKSPEASQA